MDLAPEEGSGFFGRHGWNVDEQRSVAKERRRLNREMPMAWFYKLIAPFAPKKQKEFFLKMDSNFVLLKRDNARKLHGMKPSTEFDIQTDCLYLSVVQTVRRSK